MFSSLLRILATFSFCATLCAGSAALPDASAEHRRKVVVDIAHQLESAYVLADVARHMADFLRARVDAGEYDREEIEPLADRLTRELREISHDGHLRVRYHPDPAEVVPAWSTPTDDAKARYLEHAQQSNFGFVRVEVLEGNVGYLRLDEFGDPALGGETAAAAMRFVTHTSALIIDLRANGGGGGMGAVLASYLFDGDPIHLSDFHIRYRNQVVQTRTAPFVPGPRYINKPVFILISGETASAAESFAYDLQSQKRATLVGQRTVGAANPGAFFRVSEHLAVFIPTGRPVNVITGTNWEGVGVQPDVTIDAAQALEHAHTLARQSRLAAESDSPSPP